LSLHIRISRTVLDLDIVPNEVIVLTHDALATSGLIDADLKGYLQAWKNDWGKTVGELSSNGGGRSRQRRMSSSFTQTRLLTRAAGLTFSRPSLAARFAPTDSAGP